MVEESGVAEILVLSMALLENQLGVRLHVLKTLQVLSSSSGDYPPYSSAFVLSDAQMHSGTLMLMVWWFSEGRPGVGDTSLPYAQKAAKL